jgi:hypothetical protein
MSYSAGIFALSLAILGITGKFVALSIVDICDLDVRVKKGIYLRSPFFLQPL